MSEERNVIPSQDLQEVEEKTRKAVVESENIREAVRNLTVKTLAEGKFDSERTRQIIAAIVKGATEGAEERERSADVQQALKEAMAGVDEALAKVVDASEKAIEEAAKEIREFSSEDLRKSLDDLKALEGMFLETVNQVAEKSKDTAADILRDFLKTARTTGTEVGRAAAGAAKKLGKELSEKLSETASAGAKAALKVVSAISRATAGFLEGIADLLEEKSRASGKDDDQAGTGQQARDEA